VGGGGLVFVINTSAAIAKLLEGGYYCTYILEGGTREKNFEMKRRKSNKSESNACGEQKKNIFQNRAY
jgi:hypothetical protein